MVRKAHCKFDRQSNDCVRLALRTHYRDVKICNSIPLFPILHLFNEIPLLNKSNKRCHHLVGNSSNSDPSLHSFFYHHMLDFEEETREQVRWEDQMEDSPDGDIPKQTKEKTKETRISDFRTL
jgi:hypothetical protein